MKRVLNEVFYFALLLTFLAGLSTSIGGLIAFSVKETNSKMFSILLGFSVGVMLYVSFVELLHHSIEIYGILIATIFFVIGIGIMFSFDLSISHKHHMNKSILNRGTRDTENPLVNLEKTSKLVVLGIFVHKILEGMVILVGVLEDVRLGILLAFAIALHNIPEGIAVAIPVYNSTKSKEKAFLWAFITGISEPLGTLIIGVILYPLVNEYFLGAMLAIVAGLMVYIAIDELLPVSQHFGNERLSTLGILAGIVVIALSITVF